MADFSPTQQEIINIIEPEIVTVKTQEFPTFLVGAKEIPTANNKHMLSLVNLDLTKIIKIKEIYITNQRTASATGVVASFDLIRIQDHSLGTLLVSETFDTIDILPINITARTNSNVTGLSANYLKRWKWSTDEWSTGTLDQEGFDHAFQAYFPVYKHENNGSKAITIRQNEGITVQHTINNTSGIFDVYVLFTVEG